MAGAALFISHSLAETSSQAPQRLVAEFATKRTEVQTSVVQPCKARAHELIAAERARENSCNECRAQLAQLAKVESGALARCDIRGIDALLAYVDERKAASAARLRVTARLLQQEAQSADALSKEIAAGEADAKAKFTEAAAGVILAAVLDGPTDKTAKKINAAKIRLGEVRSPGRVRKGELGAVVAELRSELAGKSPAEAKAIISAKLADATLALDELRASNLVMEQTAQHVIDGAMAPEAGSDALSLQGAYAALLTAVQVARDQGLQKVARIAEQNSMLGLLPDSIEIAAVFGNIHALRQNVEGMDALTTSINAQRNIESVRLEYFVAQSRSLLTERKLRDEQLMP